ncbi:hypothetical protein JHK84_046561 [Glycine max]|nr:hypothetical protein JHK84_046561 [Glycine max]
MLVNICFLRMLSSTMALAALKEFHGICQFTRLIHYLDLCTYQLSSGNCIKICNFESHTLALITAKEHSNCFLLTVN